MTILFWCLFILFLFLWYSKREEIFHLFLFYYRVSLNKYSSSSLIVLPFDYNPLYHVITGKLCHQFTWGRNIGLLTSFHFFWISAKTVCYTILTFYSLNVFPIASSALNRIQIRYVCGTPPIKDHPGFPLCDQPNYSAGD